MRFTKFRLYEVPQVKFSFAPQTPPVSKCLFYRALQVLLIALRPSSVAAKKRKKGQERTLSIENI